MSVEISRVADDVGIDKKKSKAEAEHGQEAHDSMSHRNEDCTYIYICRFERHGNFE